MNITMKHAPLLMLVVLLASCSNPERDLKNAKQTNTEQAYTDFIKAHPDSPLVALAKARIEENAFEQAKRTGTTTALESFIKRFGSGDLGPRARGELESVELAQAEKSASVPMWEAFLNKYAASTNATGARQALEHLEYCAATNANSIAAYEAYLAKYRDSKHVAEITTRLEPQLEERDWNQALLKNETDAYFAYAKAHPNSSRIKVLMGTVKASVSYGFTAAPFGGTMTPSGIDVVVTINEHPGFRQQVTPEVAAQWNLMTYEPSGGVAMVGEKPALKNATVLLIRKTGATGASDLGHYKILAVIAELPKE
jgi:hypothetical protein